MQTYLTPFLTIAFIHFLAVVSPGPDFALLVKNSLEYDKRTALYTALGIALGIPIHVTYCILGFALVIANSILLFNIIKFAGAAYLIYIGIKALIAKDNIVEPAKSETKSFIPSLTPWQALRQGFLCNALNPKASLFFLGLFTLVVKPTTPLYVQLFYGIWMTAVTYIWFSFLAILITHPHFRNKIFRIQKIVTKCMGGFLILFAVKLIFTHK